MELTKDGELIVMSRPTCGEAGRKNRRLTQQIGIWMDRDGTGEAFDSSTVFVLPNGARRSTDVSWIRLEQMKKPVTRDTLFLIFGYAITLTLLKFWDALTLDGLIIAYWTISVVDLIRFLRQKNSGET